jgi:hypothetical protein
VKRFVSRHLLQAGRHLSLALAVVTLAALISACGGGGGGDPASGTSNRDTRAGADAGSRWQRIVPARFDYAYDRVAAQEAPSLGIRPSNLLTVIDANEAAIETSGVVLHSYTAPGRGHGILEWPRFYEMHVNGVRLVDWVHALIAGQPPADVHCDECEASSETQD